MHGAFEALEKIHRHQRLNACLAADLAEVAGLAVAIGIVEILIF